MKTYKDFPKKYIGDSDIASLILAGYKNGEGLSLKELHFCMDSDYYAYVVDEKDVEIGDHYSLVAEFEGWLKIYDDCGLTYSVRASEISVYRAGDFGCIIKAVK